MRDQDSGVNRRPSPAEIRAAREAAGLTQAEAAALVHKPSYRTWQNWEAGSPMGLAEWELFLLKTRRRRARRRNGRGDQASRSDRSDDR